MKNPFYWFCLLLGGCTGIPGNVTAVTGFEIERYLGTRYEIARLDHSFERGLSNVTARYTPRPDGGIDVLNRGFDRKTGTWKEADGKAYFIETPDVGRLKVSFFGPFYGGYNIIALDKERYSYAMVAGPDRSYLWLLAREQSMDRYVRGKLIDMARQLGFATDKLIFVDHDNPAMEAPPDLPAS